MDSLKHLVRPMEECCTNRKRLCPWCSSNSFSDEMQLCSMEWKVSQTSSRAAGMAAPSQDPGLGRRCLAGSGAMLMQCFHLFWKCLGWAEGWLGTLPAAAEHVLSWAEHSAVAAATWLPALILPWRPNHIMPLAWMGIGSSLFTYPLDCIVLSV